MPAEPPLDHRQNDIEPPAPLAQDKRSWPKYCGFAGIALLFAAVAVNISLQGRVRPPIGYSIAALLHLLGAATGAIASLAIPHARPKTQRLLRWANLLNIYLFSALVYATLLFDKAFDEHRLLVAMDWALLLLPFLLFLLTVWILPKRLSRTWFGLLAYLLTVAILWLAYSATAIYFDSITDNDVPGAGYLVVGFVSGFIGLVVYVCRWMSRPAV